ncbi:MAG: hypothetical protein KDH19_14125, partial [Geminicoccaceae bacterium]|nr:hypothetical protein [Geminicoccaceae bacterium]
EWGFVIAGTRIAHAPRYPLPAGLKFLQTPMLAAMAEFPDDMGPVEVEENTILDHPLVAYYEAGWDRWFR